MAIVVVSDTDVAAIPYALSKDKGYSFRLDKNNKGPFAAMLPLSQVLDPAMKQDCLSSLRDQFASIPYSTVRNDFLSHSGTYYVRNAIHFAGEHAAIGKSVEMYLDRLLKNPSAAAKDTPDEQEMAERIRREMPELFQAKSGREAITLYAQLKGMLPETAAFQMVNRLVFGDTRKAAVLPERQSSPEALEAKRNAKKKMIETLLGGFDAPPTEALAALQGDDADAVGKSVSEFLRNQRKHATHVQLNRLTDRIIACADIYGIRPSFKFSSMTEDFAKNFAEGLGVEFNLKDVKTARELSRDPDASAKLHYEKIKEAVRAQHAQPEKISDECVANVNAAIASCPQHIANAAQNESLRIIAVSEQGDIGRIMPSSLGFSPIESLEGGSSGVGVYAKQALLKNPDLMREEIIHEVERRAVQTEGHRMPFSFQPEWRHAISRDAESGEKSALYQKLLIDTQAFLTPRMGGKGKSNAALAPYRKLPPADNNENVNDIIPYVEAVPDMYHIAAMVDDTLAKKGSITIGGVAGFGGKRYRTREEVMLAAFPNAWPMLEGAGEGKKLVQAPDGRIEAIDARLNPPQGMRHVLSLKERCEHTQQKWSEASHNARKPDTHLAGLTVSRIDWAAGRRA